MKTTKKNLAVLTIAMSALTANLNAQEQGSVWVTIPQSNELTINMNNGRVVTSSSTVNNLIDTYEITAIGKAFPSSRDTKLQSVYQIDCACDENDLLSAIAREHNLFSNPEIGPHYEVMFTPDDFFLSTPNDYALNMIKAQEAWNYTTGSSSVVIAITDSNFDTQHEELQGKVTYLTQGLTSSNIAHGTAVAITAAGGTNNSVGKSSIGYNSQLQLRGMSYNELLNATYSGAKIINASWVSGCTFSQYAQDVINEVYSNGSLVIASAGNGSTCGGASNLAYPASYEHVLSVTSVGSQDNHERFPGNPSITHQHNAMVDITAPGYDVSITSASGSYTTGTGSSYASAYVSGTAALILSVNPCLTPDDIETILKNSSDNIYSVNAAYAGQLGAGRLNALNAIQTALQYTTLSANADVIRTCDTPEQTIVVAPIGGTSPYEVVWSSGATGMELTVTAAGSYTYTVTDATGCVGTGEVILEDAQVLTFDSEVHNVICNSSASGSIDMMVNGGVLPYTFAWDNGSTTEDISHLYAGTYTCQITDALGCTQYASFDITEPTAVVVTAAVQNPTLVSTGSVDLTVEGGVAPYTFNWSEGAQTEDLTDLTAGMYQVIVSDANGCPTVTDVVLTEQTFNGVDGDIAEGISNSEIENTSSAGITEETVLTYSVYPNPTADVITIRTDSDEEVTVLIMDNSGKIVVSHEQMIGQIKVDMSQLPAGTYHVKGESKTGRTLNTQVIKL